MVSRLGFAALATSLFLVAACTGGTLQPPGSGPPSTGTNLIAEVVNAVAPMDVAKNPATGAYARCLRPQDEAVWAERRSKFAGKSIQTLMTENTTPATPKTVAGLLTQSVSTVLSPITVRAGMATQLYACAQQIAEPLVTGQPAKLKPMPVCGNWCGPGHPAENENPPATDTLDEVCRIHDLCYRQFGYPACVCDQMFANLLMGDRSFDSLNPVEWTMITYFQASPCWQGCKTINGVKVCGHTSHTCGARR